MGNFWTGMLDHGCTMWMATMMYRYFDYSNDVAFMKSNGFDFMKGAFNVFYAMLKEEKEKAELEEAKRKEREERREQAEIPEVPMQELLSLEQVRGEMKQEVDNMLTEMKLLAEDIKGSMVDEEL